MKYVLVTAIFNNQTKEHMTKLTPATEAQLIYVRFVWEELKKIENRNWLLINTVLAKPNSSGRRALFSDFVPYRTSDGGYAQTITEVKILDVVSEEIL